MHDRLKEIQERLDGYSVVLKKDMMFLLSALEEEQKNSKWYGTSYFIERDARISAQLQLQQSQDRERVLREALEFYADRVKYHVYYDNVNKIQSDDGRIAREALKQEENHD